MADESGQGLVRWGVGAGVLALATLGAWMSLRGADTPPPGATPSPAAVAPEAAERSKERRAARSLPVRKDSAPMSGNDPVLTALAPALQQLRCPAAGLELGAYDTRPAENHFADVRADGLHLAVPDGSGTVWLERNVRAEAEVRWEDGTCVVHPVSLIAVRGVLLDADGEPVVDHVVRGCIHGEFGRTDADGRWELMAVAGTICHPMAFVESDDGRFGKSSMQRVDVAAPGPMEGVVLSLPADDDLWSPEEQAQMADRLAMMMEKMTARRRARLPDLQAAASGLSGDARARADALVARESDFLSMVDGELERLEDPEECQAALRDAWLSLN